MKPIFLIGFMGSGKTTIGKDLASILDCPFLDSDREIERLTKNTISQIFAEKGEDHFRALEREFIESLNSDQLSVVSVGGGLPCFNEMMDLLLKNGIVIYIKTTESTLFTRLSNDLNERPLIEGMGEEELKTFIRVKLAEREKFYSGAHFILLEQNQLIEEIIQLILPLQRN
jgi:shikimate kinase